jgi:predicted secreted protein with PEFG-CTERM motif
MKHLILLLLLIPIPFAFADEIILEGDDLLGIEAVFVHGSDLIDITGVTTSTQNDVTFVIRSPNGNLVTIGQVTPTSEGMLETYFIVGDTWNEDGEYTITATQGIPPNDTLTDTVIVEVVDGVVVPEFGMVAMMILMVAITSIVILTRSKFVKY